MFKSFKILEVSLVVVCLILSFYFIIASYKGEFGVSAKYRLLAKEKVLSYKLEILIKEIEVSKNKIKRLSDTSLDLELLDEQARKILGMIGEEEQILFEIKY